MAKTKSRKRRVKGEPWVWLSGGAVATGVVMILGMVLLIAVEGTVAFWPGDVEAFVLGAPRYYVQHEENGQAWITQDDRRIVFRADDTETGWRDADGAIFEHESSEVRRATIADYREFQEMFEGSGPWMITEPGGDVVRDEDGRPVSPSVYLDNPEHFPSQWGYYAADGERFTLEELLNDDRRRDYRVLVGATRGERNMDVRQLPPNPDGTPVKSYELKVEPTEHLVRQGNQGDNLYGSGDYFRWVREDLPDLATARRVAPETYNETVLARMPLPGAALIERLEGGVLTGYVTRVTVDGEVLADMTKDGRDGVWEVFNAEKRKKREAYLERYRIEKDDLGRVQFELKEIEDELKEIRYEHRARRTVVTAIESLGQVFETWQAREPMDDEYDSAEEHGAARREWLDAFAPMLEGWWQEARPKLEKAEREVLQRARELQAERARIRAEDFARLRYEVNRMRAEESAGTYTFETSDGRRAELALAHVVRAFRPNELGLFGKLGVYFDRVWEFLTDDPREANTEGGIWPVIVGTLVMVLLMTIAVVPLGVIAALYLREYARQGPLVSAVRIAVNNLAGVPSIVFGIFGLGFFCVMVGGSIDDIFYPERLPAPTFGGGGILWAALTLALLTVPVVVVATEEALSAVPSSQREASLACGASKFQTVRKVVLPQALPGVLTGTILAMARGAGEVAPLMLVGAVKYAPYLPVDGTPPFVHLERKFMHLGFHIYDVGFQSPNVDNTRPLVFATALTLIGLVAVLNIFAIALRNRLRKKLSTSSV